MALVTVVAAVAAHQHAERFQAEPGDVQPGLDRLLTEGFQQERLAGAGGSAHDQVLPPVHPFQGAQRLLGGGRDGRQFGVPGGEGLAGGEPGPGPAGGQRGSVSSGNLLDQKRFEHLGGIPALRFGGGQQLRSRVADIGQPHPPQ